MGEGVPPTLTGTGMPEEPSVEVSEWSSSTVALSWLCILGASSLLLWVFAGLKRDKEAGARRGQGSGTARHQAGDAAEPQPAGGAASQEGAAAAAATATVAARTPLSPPKSKLAEEYERFQAAKKAKSAGRASTEVRRRALRLADPEDDARYHAARRRDAEAAQLAAAAEAAVAPGSSSAGGASASNPQPAPAPAVASAHRADARPRVLKPEPAIALPAPPGPPTVESNTLEAVDMRWDAATASPTTGGTRSAQRLTYIVEVAVLLPPDQPPAPELVWVTAYRGPDCRCTVGPDVLPSLSRCVARVAAENAGGRGLWAEGAPFWRVQPCSADGHGGDGPRRMYWFRQTLEELDVYIPVDSGGGGPVKVSAIQHEAYPKRIVLRRTDTGESLLEGVLHDEVEADECFWTLEKEDGKLCVHLNMRKRAPEFAMLGLIAPTQFWPKVLEGHPPIDGDDLKRRLPDDVVAREGTTVRQKRPYGKAAERQGWSANDPDRHADPPMEDLSNMFGGGGGPGPGGPIGGM